MTRTKFRFRLTLICLGAALVMVVAGLARYHDHKEIYDFLKDMSGYALLAIGPYIAHIFQRRAKFLELLQEEWRKINSIKQDIISYCDKGSANSAEYIDLKSRLAVAIDNMRVLFSNVGESRKYIGLYPYETLHDFRRELHRIDPARGPASPAVRLSVVENVVSSFKAFRDVFLIELAPVEPDFPIMARNLSRLRQKGVDPKLLKRITRKAEATLRRFGVQGTKKPAGI